jgi:hypothetical protein
MRRLENAMKQDWIGARVAVALIVDLLVVDQPPLNRRTSPK